MRKGWSGSGGDVGEESEVKGQRRINRHIIFRGTLDTDHMSRGKLPRQ